MNLEAYARRYPFSYDAVEIPDIGRTVERHYPDPEHAVDAWARRFVARQRDSDTMAILLGMVQAIRAEFSYNARDEMGTQDPLVTLQSGSGTCRDFALFLMEAARSLGFAARFVSGYLYDDDRVRRGERGRRRRDTCLGADLPAWRGMGRVRSDQCAGRRAQSDPGGGRARSQPGHPAERQLHRRRATRFWA